MLGDVPVHSEALLVSSTLMFQDSNFEKRRVNTPVHVFLVFCLEDKNNEMVEGSNMHMHGRAIRSKLFSLLF